MTVADVLASVARHRGQLATLALLERTTEVTEAILMANRLIEMDLADLIVAARLEGERDALARMADVGGEAGHA